MYDDPGIFDARFGLAEEKPEEFGNYVAEKIIDEKNFRISIEPKYRKMQIKEWTRKAN